ncbi:hypothetical protein, partial [Leptospira santarosai]|uniref:hypothetical protein n=1 Tax=Leptospira santarosai TaxID=28183 RepID=UPI0024AEE8E6
GMEFYLMLKLKKVICITYWKKVLFFTGFNLMSCALHLLSEIASGFGNGTEVNPKERIQSVRVS